MFVRVIRREVGPLPPTLRAHETPCAHDRPRDEERPCGDWVAVAIFEQLDSMQCGRLAKGDVTNASQRILLIRSLCEWGTTVCHMGLLAHADDFGELFCDWRHFDI